MKILHTSDWHLGRMLEGRSRIEEQVKFIDELCTIVEDEAVDLVGVLDPLGGFNTGTHVNGERFSATRPHLRNAVAHLHDRADGARLGRLVELIDRGLDDADDFV